jgi:hypothetical protein
MAQMQHLCKTLHSFTERLQQDIQEQKLAKLNEENEDIE